MNLRGASKKDMHSLALLREALWPDEYDDQLDELTNHFDGSPSHIDRILAAEPYANELVGFAELRIRNYGEGSENFQVPFLEGWYVKTAYREKGVGRPLIEEAESWARLNGYTELASNALIGNTDSIRAHAALGFEEVERTVSFLKKIN